MKNLLLKTLLLISAVRLLPHILLMCVAKDKALIKADLSRWSTVYFRRSDAYPPFWLLIRFLTEYPEFRNLFYHRTGLTGKLLSPLCRPLSTLFIATPQIGPGLFIQHGFATIIAAESIGANCWINQQVTIGYSHKGERPTLGDGITVNAGAKVIGGVKINNDAIIGANAVVVKDLPAGATAIGIPARVIKVYGERLEKPHEEKPSSGAE